MQADLPRLPKREHDAHKGDFGRALLVGGSRGMTGAIALAGLATLKSGAGLVTLAVPDPCLETVAAFEPSYMTLPLPADAEGRIKKSAEEVLIREASVRTAVGIGPGLGRSAGTQRLCKALCAAIEVPMVIDADALNDLAIREPNHTGPRILTPHPGELFKLTGVDTSDRQRQIDAATRLAKSFDVIVVLKGHRTLITDGNDQYFNHTGNPGMATGGSGDVLTGVITGLLCQGLSPLDAARLGVHVHGRAGDLAAEELGQISMTAHDLIHFLPEAFCELADD